MSWQDDIKQDFTIQTGDGSIFTVFWNKASKVVSWNAETFSFIGVRGQLTKKEEALARQFPLEFYFQGANHLFDSQRFEKELDSKNTVLIKHPLYGNITAHILSITFDNTELNVTKINCTAIETITNKSLVNPNPSASIYFAEDLLNELGPAEFTKPTIQDANQIKNTMAASKKDGLKIVTIQDQADAYTNAFNTAIGAVNVITATPIIAMAQVCNFIAMPGRFVSLVQDRIKFLEDQFQRLLQTVIGQSIKPVRKKAFEIQSAVNIAAMCASSISPISDEYKTSKSVLDIMNRISNVYNEYISKLDELEVSQGGVNEYYSYSSELNRTLSDCVNTTLSNLLVIALNGKQERFVYTMEDSNPIKLAHRYYGPSENDINLQYFIDTNNFRYDQLIGIKKGTKIVYYS